MCGLHSKLPRPRNNSNNASKGVLKKVKDGFENPSVDGVLSSIGRSERQDITKSRPVLDFSIARADKAMPYMSGYLHTKNS